MKSPCYPCWTDDDDDKDLDGAGDGFRDSGERVKERNGLDGSGATQATARRNSWRTNLADRPLRVARCSECQRVVLHEKAASHMDACKKSRRTVPDDKSRRITLKRRAAGFEDDLDDVEDEDGVDDDDDEEEEEEELEEGDDEEGPVRRSAKKRRGTSRSLRPAHGLNGEAEDEKTFASMARPKQEYGAFDGDELGDEEPEGSESQSPVNKTSIVITTTGEDDESLDAGDAKPRRLSKTRAGPGRQNQPLNVDRQCGVLNADGTVCKRSLTCKSHSMGAKRSVAGRSAPYDVLLNQWMDEHGIKRPGAANRERAAAAARARRLEAADEEASQSSDAEGLGSEDELDRWSSLASHLTSGRGGLGFGALDSDDDLDDTLASIQIAVRRPLPIVWPHLTCSRRAWFVDRRYAGRVARSALIAALRDSRPQIVHARSHGPVSTLAPSMHAPGESTSRTTTTTNLYTDVGMNTHASHSVKGRPPSRPEIKAPVG